MESTGRLPHVPAHLPSTLFAQGRNAVQVQRWLGHHSAAFTLSRYVHLLDGVLGAPLDVRLDADMSRAAVSGLR
jgi:hypothetical protein